MGGAAGRRSAAARPPQGCRKRRRRRRTRARCCTATPHAVIPGFVPASLAFVARYSSAPNTGCQANAASCSPETNARARTAAWANVDVASAEQDVRDMFARWARLLTDSEAADERPLPPLCNLSSQAACCLVPAAQLAGADGHATKRVCSHLTRNIVLSEPPCLLSSSRPAFIPNLASVASSLLPDMSRVTASVLCTAGLRRPPQAVSWTSCSSRSRSRTPRCVPN